MAKTRSQTGNIAIKKEEEDRKLDVVLHSGNNTRTRGKITKRKPPKSNNRPLPAQDVKIEEDTDTKSLLQLSSKHSNLPKGQQVFQEKINRLIDAIVNNNMSLTKAALRINMGRNTAAYYYNEYKKDPEKKIPASRMSHPRVYTTEHIENLIRYINDDKMSLSKASAKANMTYDRGRYYYRKYLQDLEHTIPISRSYQYYTQDQKDEFIGYIINDKMSILAASRKAKICDITGRIYYHKYFNDQNPAPSHIRTLTYYTQEQIKEMIGYIIDDKMTVKVASKKAKINYASAMKYLRRYLEDNNMEYPVPKPKRYTRDEMNKVVEYIVDNKMSITAASKKANMNRATVRKYYYQYLKQHNLDTLTQNCPQDKINKSIDDSVDGRMSMKVASEKANANVQTGHEYCQRCKKDHKLVMRTFTRKYTQGQIDELIGYIVDDKMAFKEAAKKAKINSTSGYKYYRLYRMNKKRDALHSIPPN